MKNYIIATVLLFFILAFTPMTALIIKDESPQDSIVTDVLREEESIRVLQVSTDKIININVKEYLIGAVAGEMPASFSAEALKAQAVACYTYLKWTMLNSDNAPNEFSDISDDSNAYQGFLTEEQMAEKWGNKYDTYRNKIESAVNSVEGEYLTYNAEPILAVFHGLSPGKTNNSEYIWNNPLPYLISVEAPGDKLSSQLISENIFTKNEFISLISDAVDTDFTEDALKLLETPDENSDGYADGLKIGNSLFSATDVRSIFSLQSPYFTVEQKKDTIIFTVYGKGHGLGMSQYSADFMARQGSDYKEILSHFYPGTEISKD